jgi:hypothetical protein
MSESAPTPEASDFYSSALTRIRRFMLVLAPMLTLAAFFKFGSRPALGFLTGSIVAFLNFLWLKSGISGLADRVTQTGTRQSGKGLIFRFVLRYILLAAAAYAIITSFPAALPGLFAGLFLPVAAIVCEAVYELYAVLKQ